MPLLTNAPHYAKENGQIIKYWVDKEHSRKYIAKGCWVFIYYEEELVDELETPTPSAAFGRIDYYFLRDANA